MAHEQTSQEDLKLFSQWQYSSDSCYSIAQNQSTIVSQNFRLTQLLK